jgi:hypothetical protein
MSPARVRPRASPERTRMIPRREEGQGSWRGGNEGPRKDGWICELGGGGMDGWMVGDTAWVHRLGLL